MSRRVALVAARAWMRLVMFAVSERGDDGLTDAERQRMAEAFDQGLGAPPSREFFGRARAEALSGASRDLLAALVKHGSPATREAALNVARDKGIDLEGGAR